MFKTLRNRKLFIHDLIYIYSESFEKLCNSCTNICLWACVNTTTVSIFTFAQNKKYFKQTMKLEHCFLETYKFM